MTDDKDTNILKMTVEIVAAYVAHNALPRDELAGLIAMTHETLKYSLSGKWPEVEAEPQKPAVPVKRSITDDYIICLEDGKKFKSLKRHLHSAYGMSPDEYRKKWGLAKDYPMVAPAYASARSNLAKSLGLGRKSVPADVPSVAPVAAAPAPIVAAAPAAKRGRAAKVNGNSAALQ